MDMDIKMDDRRKKLYYRATHRGIKEMDLILTAFSDRELAGLDEAELDQFETLLDVPDQDLYFWITGADPVPEEHRTELLDRIRVMPPVAGHLKA